MVPLHLETARKPRARFSPFDPRIGISILRQAPVGMGGLPA
jgi:hypothetical protein